MRITIYVARQEDIVQARRRDRRRERRHMRGGLVRGGRVGRGGQAILAAELVEDVDEDDEREHEAETKPDQEATTTPSRSGAPYGQSTGIQYGDVGSNYHHITDIGQSSGTQYNGFSQFSDFQTESPSDQYGMGLDLQLAPPTALEPQEEGGARPLRRMLRPHVVPSCGTHSRKR
nr:hypothetical protein Iba_chr08cCG9310 [Ipomoea batatas]GMD27194.1 hypothetical protein Iba_chr08dCG11420 [Ipomoea batatas]GMD29441.1 hypothetical protein Iba_chr08fCG3160 [Ipomoea batatas]